MWFAEIFAELLLFFEDYKFWKKKKAQRKYEKEHNLPKKTMVYPSTKIYVIALIVLSISGGLFFYFFTFLTICLTVTSASIVVNETLYLSLCALRDSCVNESSEKYFHFVLFAAPILSRFYALIAKWRDRDAQVHSAS